MTQEPVALMRKTDITEFCEYNMEMAENDNPNSFAKWIPLYTHPLNPKYDPETGEPLIDGYPLFSGLPHPVKELTDEEIADIAVKTDIFDPKWVYLFARAILRKAQEQ